MLGEWYLPPGECQVILPIKKVPFPFPTTLSSPFRQGSLKPRFCKQITRTPRNPPGPRIRRSEAGLRAAQGIGVAERGGEVVELTLERRQEQEARVGRLPRRDVAEVDRQRWRLRLIANLGSDDLEGIEQALLVLH